MMFDYSYGDDESGATLVESGEWRASRQKGSNGGPSLVH